MPDLPFTLTEILKFSMSQGVSDIHLKPGRPPIFRRGGPMDLVSPKNMSVLDSDDVMKLFEGVIQEHQRVQLRERGQVDFGWGETGIGRLRASLFRSRAGTQAVMRVVPSQIPTLADLNLPKALTTTIANERRGLVLVTGTTGSGKTTTLAALADQINRVRSCHILTIEDPIEYVIEDRRSVVTQREVGTDTVSFPDGLRSALRQDPDVIVVGEMRDRETMEVGLHAAETGHLVLSTLHTIDARETLTRVISVFEQGEQGHARLQLAETLRAVVSQRLVPRQDGQGRVPAVEVMLVTARIRDLLMEPEAMDEIADAIGAGQAQYGMQTFDQSLMGLYRDGWISYDEAISQCTNPADFALRCKGIGSGSPDATR
ncbi:MAG: PilT/PilU family type 4a pilus ATPase [Deltaproteobacteria bacterium]|nr:PilT/PilU family type 4a pilus ATPase [Deltaproteobacteria bacterium]